MDNENNFINNFRTLSPMQAPKVMSAEEMRNPTFQGVRGGSPEGYGTQQNAIGMGALGVLTSFLDPVVLPLLLGGAITMAKKQGSNEPTIIIDKTKVQDNFKELQKLPELPTPDELNTGKWPQFKQLNTPVEFVQGGR